MHKITRAETRPEPAGLVIHGAARYDLVVWLFTFGGERRMREKMLRLAELNRGEHVLDIGCGTGTFAIMAKRRVGATGLVHGLDASPEMVAHARKKAKRANVDVAFAHAPAQALPLADQSVDVVLSTLMLHHLPRKARPDTVREIKRVLRPGGRFLAVDFVKPAAGRKSFMDRFHRHGFVQLEDVVAELESAGFTIAESGPVGERDLQFVRAINGSGQPRGRAVAHDRGHEHQEHETEAHGGRHRHGKGLVLAILATLGVLALIALHGGALLSLSAFSFDSEAQSLALVGAGALALLIVVKLGLLRFAHGFRARLFGRWLGAREE